MGKDNEYMLTLLNNQAEHKRRIDTLLIENQLLRSMYQVLYEEFQRTVDEYNYDQEKKPQPLVENSNNETKHASTHKWTEKELALVSNEYMKHEGEWTEDVEGMLHEAFGGTIRMQAIWAKWENCRYLDSGKSFYPSASRMHKKVWKESFSPTKMVTKKKSGQK